MEDGDPYQDVSVDIVCHPVSQVVDCTVSIQKFHWYGIVCAGRHDTGREEFSVRYNIVEVAFRGPCFSINPICCDNELTVEITS